MKFNITPLFFLALMLTVLSAGNYSENFPLSEIPGVSQYTGGSGGAFTQIQQFQIDPDNLIILEDVYENFDAVLLQPYASQGKTGAPELPLRVFRFELPKHSEVVSAELQNARAVKFDGVYNIIPSSDPVPLLPGYQPRIQPDPFIYLQDYPYPQCPLNIFSGSGYQGTTGRVYLSPTIVNPLTGELFLITEGEIILRYKQNYYQTSDTEDYFTQNIIITSESLIEYADRLDSLHEAYGILTELVTTEYIDSHYAPVAYPDIPGMMDTLPEFEFNYDGDLAARIITYLREALFVYPNLISVTIFGDADIVPPSFYYYMDAYYISVDFWAWHPSDFYYSSPDQDLIMNLAVGRLPVSNAEEAEQVLAKINRFNSNASGSWFLNALALGGDTFNNNKHDGELTISYGFNKNWFDNFTVDRQYATLGNFDLDHTLMRLRSDDYGFMLFVGHGGGNTYAYDTWPSFTVDNLVGSGYKEFLPVYLFMNCLNGCFDKEIMPTQIYFDQGLAEAVLLEDEGGILAVGATRV
ncbi:hypothetical protein JW877_04710, partial [bacterium]|nr:hypothetical protein [bacterium]